MLSSEVTLTNGQQARHCRLPLQINIFVGLGLLSMPYAMRLSGWLGLAAMAAMTCLFCLSGKLLVQAFDKMPLHCAQTYPALGLCPACNLLILVEQLHSRLTQTALLVQGNWP